MRCKLCSGEVSGSDSGREGEREGERERELLLSSQHTSSVCLMSWLCTKCAHFVKHQYEVPQ